MARRMTHPAAGRVGHPPVPASPVAEGPAGAALTPHGTAASRPPRMWWVGLLLLPGGLILAVGLGIAWAGLVLLIPGLRRLSTAMPSTLDVGAAAVAPPQADQSCPAGTPVTGSAPQPYGEPHEPSQRDRKSVV